MAHLRVHEYNCINIHQVYLEKHNKKNEREGYIHPVKMLNTLLKARVASMKSTDNISSLHQGADWS